MCKAQANVRSFIAEEVRHRHIIFVAPAGLFRDGVARLLGDFEACTEVRCADYQTSAFENGLSGDLLVLDGDHEAEALDAAGMLRRFIPRLPALALLTEIDQQTIDAFIAVGVAGCLNKSESAGALLGALQVVQAGATPGSGAYTCILTPRQIEVLALAARGESNKSIARQLNIAEGTVKVHLYTVYKALKVGSPGAGKHRGGAAGKGRRCATSSGARRSAHHKAAVLASVPQPLQTWRRAVPQGRAERCALLRCARHDPSSGDRGRSGSWDDTGGNRTISPGPLPHLYGLV